MSQFQYGFIVKAPGYSYGNQVAGMESNVFKSTIVGVGSLEEALDAAKVMVKNGVTLIELCSGFKAADAQSIFEAIEGAAKVGYISEFYAKQD